MLPPLCYMLAFLCFILAMTPLVPRRDVFVAAGLAAWVFPTFLAAVGVSTHGG